MDPNQALAELRQLVDKVYAARDEGGMDGNDDEYDSLQALAETFRGLDTWLSSGGFTPHAWHRQRTAPDFLWMSAEFIRTVRRLTPGMSRDGVDCSDDREILQVDEGEMALAITDEQGRQIILDGRPEAVQRLTVLMRDLARRGITVTEPAWKPEPFGGPIPGVDGSHLPEHEDDHA